MPEPELQDATRDWKGWPNFLSCKRKARRAVAPSSRMHVQRHLFDGHAQSHYSSRHSLHNRPLHVEIRITSRQYCGLGPGLRSRTSMHLLIDRLRASKLCSMLFTGALHGRAFRCAMCAHQSGCRGIVVVGAQKGARALDGQVDSEGEWRMLGVSSRRRYCLQTMASFARARYRWL